jgi:hypothetical protein
MIGMMMIGQNRMMLGMLQGYRMTVIVDTKNTAPTNAAAAFFVVVIVIMMRMMRMVIVVMKIASRKGRR